MAMTPTAMSSLSTVGSRSLPSLETWWVRRATCPSTQSVEAATAYTTTAATSWRAPKSSQRNTGSISSLMKVMMFGAVNTLSSISSSGTVCSSNAFNVC